MLDNDCAICCNSYTDFARYGCGHRLCCRCAARLLYLYNDRKCPICKESRTKPLFDSVVEEACPDHPIPLGGNGHDGSDLYAVRNGARSGTPGKSAVKHKLISDDDLSFNPDKLASSVSSLAINGGLEDSYATYASRGIRARVKGLLAIRCKECKQVFGTRKELVTHFRSRHSSLLCSTCLENNHQFWYEYSSYTPESLSLHRRGQLKEPGFDGHVFCVFCSFYLYNKDTAKKHCNQEHQLCTVCDILGNKHQYYKSFLDLEAHYRSQHFCCSNPVCIKNLCYVYAYKSELWAHSISHHGLEMQLSDISLKNEKNPTVLSLSEKKDGDGDEESIYRTGTNILNPLVNSPFFPTFSRAASPRAQDEASSSVPSFLNRQILQQAESSSKQRASQVRNITPLFCSEISTSIEKYVGGMKSIKEMVCEIEDAVGKPTCLRILESVSFVQKQREVKEFLVNYKKELKFPTFKKTPARNGAEDQRKKTIGFKVLDASGTRQSMS